MLRSRIRPFDWCQNQRPWMTLNCRYALCCRKDASFWAHRATTKIWIYIQTIRPYCQRQKCRPMTLVSKGIRFMRIFAEIQRGGGDKRQWGCRERQFSAFSLAIFGYFWDEACSVIIWRYALCNTIQYNTTIYNAHKVEYRTSNLRRGPSYGRRLFSDPKVHDLEWPWLAISR